MAKFGYTVDTAPMASEMKRVTDKVGNVTTAVVGMQTAVIAAEVKATDTVCKKLNHGFFQLIFSQLAQKSVTAKSETSAVGMEMVSQQKALLKLKERMDNDYRMISSRYKALFEDLNKELHTRVAELDRPVIDLVEKDISTTLNRLNRLVAAVPVNQSESLTLSQRLAAAHIKENAQLLIGRMKEYLISFKQQQRNTQNIQVNQKVKEAIKLYLPVLVVHQRSESGREATTILPTQSVQRLGGAQSKQINEQALRSGDALSWHSVPMEGQKRVAGEFQRMVDQASASTRIKEMTRKLFEQNATWQEV